ncbi:hypothetical protein SELMODRAFT_426954 [Selaginella moellendorffii]|uniref:Senescence domain-containing protein n=1 Tax=Selaginella moellendorffii TaxID=88036 RepID=D8SY11_SELML|nr:hypothetical protein SELMODRAFT_426954 [Selaginella moellendorffii]
MARVGRADALAAQREGISSLSSVIRDHRMAMGSTSRRDRLLGVNSSLDFNGSSSEASEFKEEDVWGIVPAAVERSKSSLSLEDVVSDHHSTSSLVGSSGKRGLALDYSSGALGLSSIARGSATASSGGGGGRVTSASRMIPQRVAGSGVGGGGGGKAAIQHQSAPVNVLDWSRILGSKNKDRSSGNFGEDGTAGGVVDDLEDDEDENFSVEKLPPHELVARSQTTTFSVFEGAGRTLKGRDLSRVRNAVLKQTGFL